MIAAQGGDQVAPASLGVGRRAGRAGQGAGQSRVAEVIHVCAGERGGVGHVRDEAGVFAEPAIPPAWVFHSGVKVKIQVAAEWAIGRGPHLRVERHFVSTVTRGFDRRNQIRSERAADKVERHERRVGRGRVPHDRDANPVRAGRFDRVERGGQGGGFARAPRREFDAGLKAGARVDRRQIDRGRRHIHPPLPRAHAVLQGLWKHGRREAVARRACAERCGVVGDAAFVVAAETVLGLPAEVERVKQRVMPTGDARAPHRRGVEPYVVDLELDGYVIGGGRGRGHFECE